MAAQYRGFGIVERAAKGFAERGTGGGNDDDFIHVQILENSVEGQVEGVTADGVDHAAGAFLALDFDGDAHGRLHAALHFLDRDQLRAAAHPRADLAPAKESAPGRCRN